LDTTYATSNTPIYSSIDLRVSNHKAAVVDTNLFPAGFNNLSLADFPIVSAAFSDAIQQAHPNARDLLLVPEEHTRNLWYLENIRIISSLLEAAGFNVLIATFLDDDPEYCQKSDHLTIETATGKTVSLYCLHRIIQQIEDKSRSFDLAILNNDLTSGIPAILRLLKIPIAPPPAAGWHQRHKSDHFDFTHSIVDQMAAIFKFDPWLLRCDHRVVKNVDITVDADRDRLADTAADLLRAIQDQYRVHHIQEKPLLFLKSDSGTYGMGVMPIEDSSEIIDLNRKGRNKLHKGKGSQLISQFILQEGVPSALSINGQAAELCIYQVATQSVGAFYRMNEVKSNRDNLNSQGMVFQPIHWNGQSDSSLDPTFQSVCRLLAKTAVYAAGLELGSIQTIKS